MVGVQAREVETRPRVGVLRPMEAEPLVQAAEPRVVEPQVQEVELQVAELRPEVGGRVRVVELQVQVAGHQVEERPAVVAELRCLAHHFPVV